MAEDKATRIIDPKQKAYLQTHYFKGQPFRFFGDNRGCIVSKNLRTTYDSNTGNLVSDIEYNDLVKHFKNMGFIIQDSTAPIENLNKKVNNQVKPKEDNKPSNTQIKKEDKEVKNDLSEVKEEIKSKQ